MNLTFTPQSSVRQHLGSLVLSSLQNKSVYYTAVQGSVAWRLLLQQSCLTSLCVACLEYSAEAGIQNAFLHKLPRLQTLVKLDLPLSSQVTNAGIQALSHMTSLKSLRLPVSKYEAGLSSNSVKAFTALTQLAYLSLGPPQKLASSVSLA